jgi:MFS family permease
VKFKSLGASSLSVSLLLSIIPMAINMGTNPIISFRSDRFRSRWGRRIPFIVVSMPFLVLLLIGVGYGDSLGYWLHQNIEALSSRFHPNTVALLVIGILMTLFNFVNMFVASVFWYLFNDVVPEHLLARFMSWFRSVSVGAIAFYNYFVFGYAKTHADLIFLGAAILYLVGFGLMCLYVKEGEYPPAPPYDAGDSGFKAAVRTYGKECHTHSHYWYVFLIAIGMGGVLTSGPFMIYFYNETGLDEDAAGKIMSYGNIAMFFMILASGWLADRFHPIRVVIIGLIIQTLIATPASLLWLFYQPDPKTSYMLWTIITIALMSPAGALVGMLDPPLFMRIFPRSRYGQFCSANALWRSFSVIIGGLILGAMLDFLKANYGARTAFVSLPIWHFLSYAIMLVGTILLYRSWKRYGGDTSYIPPVEDMPDLAPQMIGSNPGASVAPTPNVPIP